VTATLVARKGTGRLHIAVPVPGGVYATICGRTLTGPKIHTWRAGRQASAVWVEWKRCTDCVSLNRKYGR